MGHHDRFNLVRTTPDALAAFGEVEKILETSPLDPLLRHLVKLRVSQINGCAYCVDMHTREAREDGESNQRLDSVIVWRNVDCFSAADKAALAWAEAMTIQGTGVGLNALHSDLTVHFSDVEVDHLMLVVVMINTWNRLQVANHNATF